MSHLTGASVTIAPLDDPEANAMLERQRLEEYAMLATEAEAEEARQAMDWWNSLPIIDVRPTTGKD